MKLYLIGHDYKFAIEQMLFTLFPGEPPLHPKTPPAPGESALVSQLDWKERDAHCSATLLWGGQKYRKTVVVTVGEKSDELVRNRLLSFALKQAFYGVSVQALGKSPAWGALTGVRPVKLPTRAIQRGKSPQIAQLELEKIYHVAPLRAELAMDCAQASLKVQEEFDGDSISLYIGIPFCPTRCTYCSFISAGVGKALKLVEGYLGALTMEIERTGAVLRAAGKTVQTVYIGGGTPTTLSAPQLDRLLTTVEQHLPMRDGAEYTVEMGRSDTISAEKLALCAPHGVNRISINPQTMEGHVLSAMGRTHSPQDIVDCYQMARQLPIPLDINMDLIAGLPQDTVEGFQRSLRKILELRPENITVHTLAIKKGSALARSGAGLPTAEAVAEMLDFAWHVLRQAGYKPYYLYRQKYMSGGFENVSWCLEGKENKYNIIMMEELHSVISLGAGGITKLVNPRTGEILRLNNPKYPHDYLADTDKILRQKDRLLDIWQNGDGDHGLSNSGDQPQN